MSKKSNSSSIKGKKRLGYLSEEIPKRKRMLLEDSSSDTGSSSEEIPKRKRAPLEDSSCDTASSSSNTASSSEEKPKRYFKAINAQDGKVIGKCSGTTPKRALRNGTLKKQGIVPHIVDKLATNKMSQVATKEYVHDLIDHVSDESTSEEEVIRPRTAKGSSMFKHIDIEGNVKGTYTGATPKQAASKAFTKELRGLKCKDSTTNILLLHPETNNVYSYTAERTLLDNPAVIEVAGKEITFTHRNVIKENIIKRKV